LFAFELDQLSDQGPDLTIWLRDRVPDQDQDRLGMVGVNNDQTFGNRPHFRLIAPSIVGKQIGLKQRTIGRQSFCPEQVMLEFPLQRFGLRTLNTSSPSLEYLIECDMAWSMVGCQTEQVTKVQLSTLVIMTIECRRCTLPIILRVSLPVADHQPNDRQDGKRPN